MPDPKPGDEIIGATVRVKVVRVTLDESGICDVCYLGAHRNHPYVATAECHKTLAQWRLFVGDHEVVNHAKEKE